MLKVQAMQQAAAEGHLQGSTEFFGRVLELASDALPSIDMKQQPIDALTAQIFFPNVPIPSVQSANAISEAHAAEAANSTFFVSHNTPLKIKLL